MIIKKIYPEIKKSIKAKLIGINKFDYLTSTKKAKDRVINYSEKSKKLLLDSLKTSNKVLLLPQKLVQHTQNQIELLNNDSSSYNNWFSHSTDHSAIFIDTIKQRRPWVLSRESLVFILLTLRNRFE